MRAAGARAEAGVEPFPSSYPSSASSLVLSYIITSESPSELQLDLYLIKQLPFSSISAPSLLKSAPAYSRHPAKLLTNSNYQPMLSNATFSFASTLRMSACFPLRPCFPLPLVCLLPLIAVLPACKVFLMSGDLTTAMTGPPATAKGEDSALGDFSLLACTAVS
jgi:hypothetical protein